MVKHSYLPLDCLCLRQNRRLSLSIIQVHKSLLSLAMLLKMPQYQQSRRVSVFLSMKDEIQTHKIMEDLFSSRKDCFIPQYSKAGMKMVRLDSTADYNSLPETRWKIKQPALDDVREDALDTGGLDLILMPGLGFTKRGLRLGRGKGYYDNYLRLCRKKGSNPLTIALAYSVQILDDIPMSESDVPVDHVLFADKSEMRQ
ncbi:5-formyltetrahydrofolate cyclo-ligase-like isoform X2 [Liolophura sinensis]|uniref:5-formyltetrahydrofolate cyclo-ligase-like isoform X2 n=1 Tax=Liolophura sinensis TaxID=3198878 RepID=UPI0031589514